jgi:hypothetical protein
LLILILLKNAGSIWKYTILSNGARVHGGLLIATVFPGTANVEADFSELKWTKDEYSVGYLDSLLKAKLHTKQ